MLLPILNFIVCAMGALICLFTLITRKVDTKHWKRLFFIGLSGLAFVLWLIYGMAYKDQLLIENIVCRFLVVLAICSNFAEMYRYDKK